MNAEIEKACFIALNKPWYQSQPTCTKQYPSHFINVYNFTQQVPYPPQQMQYTSPSRSWYPVTLWLQ